MADSKQLQVRKNAVRTQCIARRKEWHLNLTETVCLNIAKNFLNTCDVKGKIVSGFLPIGSEIDVRPLLKMCLNAGAEICLPCVEKNNAPLLFRKWREGDVLVSEIFGTKAPHHNAQELIPDIVVTPMLAFDTQGYRMGYGGGFYDRTFAHFKKIKDIQAIGVALDIQKIDTVPTGDYDIALNKIITETKVYTF